MNIRTVRILLRDDGIYIEIRDCVGPGTLTGQSWQTRVLLLPAMAKVNIIFTYRLD
jgi:hypothetical protein